MSAVKEMREKYGISQADLSFYLSVSLSLLKQNEVNNRSLPTTALLKLSSIVLYETKAVKEPATIPNTGPTPAPGKKLNRAVRKAELQLCKAQQEIEKIKKRYGQAQKLLALCSYLLGQNSTDGLDKIWLEGQLLSAQQKLKTYSEEVQTLLLWRIACLEFATQKGNEMMTIAGE